VIYATATESIMPSIDRPLSGRALHFRLGSGRHAELIDHGLLEKAGRSARTLLKDGPLRVTLVALGAGGSLADHRAEGPITIYVLTGSVVFRVGEDQLTLESGDLQALGAGVTHGVSSPTGGSFLLTVATTSPTA
jgi:quercetin dioxygenase-like cupin family protein